MITVRAPFRLPLGGGGTDLPSYYHKNDGFLITAAINKYMFMNINVPAIVNKIKIQYSKVESVNLDEIEKIEHEIVRESLKYLKINSPVEISSMADLSAGTGMGSSSSYTVALLKGLNAMLKRDISTHDLAEEACKVEIDLIGKPIGKQDQYAAAYGGLIQLDIDRLGNVKVTPLNLDTEVIYELENRLLMFYTGKERDANSILGEQSEKIKKAKAGSQNTALAYMDKIKSIGYKIKDALLSEDIDGFGKLMHEHWLTKKSVSDKMSNSEIDTWYDLAMSNGAIGGKIMGAGGGGFLLLCVENGKRKHLRKTMEQSGLKYMDFKFDWEGAKVLVNI
ncbi:MAG: galactokinase [Ignavibacteria bacterium]|nr:galactokinase [Ignavibacteria bacterium]